MALTDHVATGPLPSIDAPLTFFRRDGGKPATHSGVPGEPAPMRDGDYETHIVTIADMRPVARSLDLDRDGFALTDHATAVEDFYDEAEIRAVYYPEMEALIKRFTGARRVLIFDHTLRTGNPAQQAEKKVRAPVPYTHNDFTDWSAPKRARDLLPAAEAEALLEHRVALIQVWRPINRPVTRSPLCICDAQTIAPDDLIPARRYYPDRVGETQQLVHNPAQRWYYAPAMRRDEALIFKVYDSKTDGRARFTAHTAFEHPDTPADAPPRESIEIRALVFFAPLD